jgi:formamidopyrimidine-DNA glycosylase
MVAERLSGSRIRGVRVLDAGVLRNATAEAFRESLSGQSLKAPERWRVNGCCFHRRTDLLVHNGMTGRLYVLLPTTGNSVETDRNDWAIISTDGGDCTTPTYASYEDCGSSMAVPKRQR